jgi:uridine kinase
MVFENQSFQSLSIVLLHAKQLVPIVHFHTHTLEDEVDLTFYHIALLEGIHGQLV